MILLNLLLTFFVLFLIALLILPAFDKTINDAWEIDEEE
jgi:hypothetical protein